MCRLFSIGWLASLIIILTACTPADKIPLSGSVLLEYAGTSPSHDAVMFTLANGTNRPIYFRGNPEPLNASMICSARREAEAFVQTLFDPPAREKDVEVASSERLHLNLYILRLPPDFKDHQHRCRLDLTLEDGAVIESAEFVP
jgi:hypothetical protein